MRGRVVGALLLIIAACGGGTATVDNGGATSTSSSSSSGSSSSSSGDGSTSSSTSSSGGTTADASTKDAATDANDATCPASFKAPDGHCKIGLSCAYAQGRCDCVGHCGGAPPPPNEDQSHWVCTAKRTDGCPDVKPVNGTACTQPGKFCDYGDCCIEQFVCTAGKWKSDGPICPP